MSDLKSQMEEQFITYASYVILDRAIPDVVDGLKPVQRRILETLWRQNDDKLHKVANIVGQTMQLHPHGDAAIYEALVNLANKGYLLDKQGNFGNIFTGDPSAASRYIETRLSELAKETLFNPDITPTIPSYDGRNNEPVVLPSKIPLLLMQGAEGIAVGMSTRILPHNFTELLDAQISYLEGKNFKLFPDFPTGGVMDKSLYDKGWGKVKLRAKIDIIDPKTLLIKEICYGTTTESLIRSIDEAAKKGKIKIEEINDYTAETVEIEIKLPRGQYAEELLDALYGFTECEVSLNSQIIVIKDNMPWETDVNQILIHNTENLVLFLKKEQQIEKDRLQNLIFYKTLERIFIEKRLYKKIETVKTLDGIHEALTTSLKPFIKKLLRVPTREDHDRLLQIPIRRISQFDINKNQDEIKALDESLEGIEKNLKNVKKFTINYLKTLSTKYGADFPRKTRIKAIEELDKRAIETKDIKIGYDEESSYVGTKVSGTIQFKGTNFDKLLILFKDGRYKATNLPEKQYFDGLAWVGIADKKTILSALYKHPKTGHLWVKRFVVDKFILDKMYSYLEEGSQLIAISAKNDQKIEVQLTSKTASKDSKTVINLGDIEVKGSQTKGICLVKEKVKKVTLI